MVVIRNCYRHHNLERRLVETDYCSSTGLENFRKKPEGTDSSNWLLLSLAVAPWLLVMDSSSWKEGFRMRMETDLVKALDSNNSEPL